MKATRDAFGLQIVKSASQNDKIIVLSADLTSATKVNTFKKNFPERFFDIGIAENNMIGIASGLSEHGYKVFLTSFASFLTGKYDTIRCSIAYPKCPVVLVGTHGGLAIGHDGVTQMGLEDISLMRSLPEMIILNPATFIEAQEIVEWLAHTELKNPVYLRLGRQPVKEVFSDNPIFYDNYKFEFNKIQSVKEGKKAVVFSTGCILSTILEAVENIDIEVINVPTLKPINAEAILSYLTKYDKVFTVEDHSIVGGLGTIIAEIIAEYNCNCKLKKIGVQDIFPESGKPEDLYEKYGLSVNQIKQTILNSLK